MSNDEQHTADETPEERIVRIEREHLDSASAANSPIRDAWLTIRGKIGDVFTRAQDAILGKPASRGGREGHPDEVTKRVMTRRGALGTLATTLGVFTTVKGIGYMFGGSGSHTEDRKTEAAPVKRTGKTQMAERTPTEENFGPLDDPTTGTKIFNALVGKSSREQWIRPTTVHLMLKTVHEMCERWRGSQKKGGLTPREAAEKSAVGKKVDAQKALLRVADSYMTPGVGADATPQQMQEFNALTDRLAELEARLGELAAKEKERKPHIALQIEEEAMPTGAMCAEGILVLWDVYEFLRRGSVRKILGDFPYAIIRIIEHYILWGFLPRAAAKEGTATKEVEKGMKFARAALIATLASTAVGGVAISNLWPTSKVEDQPAATKPAEVSAAQTGQAIPLQKSQGTMVHPDDPEHPANLKVDIREQEAAYKEPSSQPPAASSTNMGTTPASSPSSAVNSPSSTQKTEVKKMRSPSSLTDEEKKERVKKMEELLKKKNI